MYLVATWNFILSILSKLHWLVQTSILQAPWNRQINWLIQSYYSVQTAQHHYHSTIKYIKMISFQNQDDLTTRCSSLNTAGGITLRPSFGKNICIIRSLSSQVALRNTPFGSLTTMKRSLKKDKKEHYFSQSVLSIIRTILSRILVGQSALIPRWHQ